MEQKGKSLLIIGLVAAVGFAAYLDSPYSSINKNYYFSPSEPVTAQLDEKTEPDPGLPVLENVLERKKEVGGYLIETYREYEIYKDKDGKVTKRVPTSHYEYLRYELD